jgi:hypothetical protein
MRLFKPFHPIHLEIFAPHRENNSATYKVYLTLTLELPSTVPDERMVAVVINRAQFDPPGNQNVTGFCFLLGNQGFGLGQFPYLSVNPRTPGDVDRIFNFHNNLDFFVFVSPYQHIPPAIMDSAYNGLHVFYLPEKMLQKSMQFQLMFKDSTRPGQSTFPDEIYGTTAKVN